MSVKRFRIFMASLTAFCIACVTQAQETTSPGIQQAGEVRFDVGKSLIEAPVKKALLKASNTNPQDNTPIRNQRFDNPPSKKSFGTLDVSKTFIEIPSKKLLESTKFTAVLPNNFSDNPPCQPGLVTWHRDLQEAKAASLRSGKPILLFQLLGKLDEKFT
ncbi:MAG: hypothetical protein P8J33_11890 [Pirellulaceae bacterium]|nr:hypothetical protein [Pirellulaceae bacterium]